MNALHIHLHCLAYEIRIEIRVDPFAHVSEKRSLEDFLGDKE